MGVWVDPFRVRWNALESKAYLPYIGWDDRIGAAMPTLTVTAKGQVTLRKDLLAHLGVRPGEKIDVEKLSNGRIEVTARRPSGQISDVFDALKSDNGPVLSIEEMNEAIAEGWAGGR